MQITITLPPELDWVVTTLREQLERAESEVLAGSRPDFAAGYYAATKDLIVQLETSYDSLRQQMNNVRSMPRG